MSKVKVTLPGLEIPVTGKQVTFTAPCDCSSVECIQIDGVDYIVVDSLGSKVTGNPSGGAWVRGAQVSVILDCENRKAYIQNIGKIGAGMVNPNLLHNWYFVNPVNQRGQTEYSADNTAWVYAVDRWKMMSATLTKEEGYCKFVAPSDKAGYKRFLQQTGHTLKAGETYTLSLLAKINDISVCAFRPCTSSYGQIETVSGGTGITIRSTTTEPTVFSYTFVPTQDIANVGVEILVSNSSAYYLDADIYGIKLECGDTQTLAHQDASGKWVLNEIPNYSEELLKCIQSTADASDTYANKVIYHTGNKPTAADVGAVNKAGDTMTGALTVRQRLSAEFRDVITAKLEAHSGGAVDFQKVSIDGKYAAVRLNATTDLAKRLALCGNDTGSWFEYSILHTGNMDSLLSNNSRAKIATGSYVGTGTYGENNPNSIACGFKPKMFFIAPANANVAATCVWVSPATKGIVDYYGYSSSSSSEESVTLVWNDDGVSWYFDAGSYYENVGYSIQMNDSDKVYYWCAIG